MSVENGDDKARVVVKIPNVNYLLARILLSALARRGANRVIISPGSRSTPLAHTAMEMAEFEKYVLIDERSAAFFALGLAKADAVPAILICTSGTAAANYFPAVIEAAQSFTPLIVLSADRPAALRHTGAPQTIDQQRLYGDYVRCYAETPPAPDNAALQRGIRDTADMAFQLSVGEPHGPVHINVPLAEPLAPVDEDAARVTALWTELVFTDEFPKSPEGVHVVQADPDILARIQNAQAGLIVAGPGAARSARDCTALYRLSRQLGWPVLADVLSGLRFTGEPVIPHYDIFLRNDTIARLAPDLVLAFGAHPTSKTLNTYLNDQRGVHTIRVQAHTRNQDPERRSARDIVTDVALWCDAVTKSISAARDSWLLEPFQRAAASIRAQLANGVIEHDSAAELSYVKAAYDALRAQTTIVLANSMAIRYADSMFAYDGRTLTAFGMRGANGIDGTLSHAAGLSAASQQRTLLITGDLAFLHDLGGLFAVKKYAPRLDIVLLNNNGGGIFHFLPVHESTPHFELTHGTAHDVQLCACAELFGIGWARAHSPTELATILRTPITGARVIEVVTARETNHTRHQHWMDQLSTLNA
jgi:2-succinyl-5-enolpyruvyl-6-hydroxy-3-cyclohexene-1-carboxylate synthase